MKITLFVDDERRPHREDAHSWILVRTGELAINLLNALREINPKNVFDIYLDHDLGSGISGYDIAKYIVDNNITEVQHVYVISMNPVGAQNICDLLNHYGWSAKRVGLDVIGL